MTWWPGRARQKLAGIQPFVSSRPAISGTLRGSCRLAQGFVKPGKVDHGSVLLRVVVKLSDGVQVRVHDLHGRGGSDPDALSADEAGFAATFPSPAAWFGSNATSHPSSSELPRS
jgi:hypothetical protein